MPRGSPGAVASPKEALAVIARLGIGYPLLLKASAGGGGRGIRRVTSSSELPAAFESAAREAAATFGDGSLFVEELIEDARHIEVQLLADSAGTVAVLLERDCSAQVRCSECYAMKRVADCSALRTVQYYYPFYEL